GRHVAAGEDPGRTRGRSGQMATGGGAGMLPGFMSSGVMDMISAFSGRADRTVRLLWFLELLAMLLAVSVAVWLRFIDDPLTRSAFVETAPVRTLLVAVFITGAMAAFGLY